MGLIRLPHEADVLLHAALHAHFQAHGVFHALWRKAIDIHRAARHVTFAEMLVVQHHLALAQPHGDGKALVDHDEVVCVALKRLGIVEAGKAFRNHPSLHIHGEMVEVARTQR